jgi:hypothetical protein
MLSEWATRASINQMCKLWYLFLYEYVMPNFGVVNVSFVNTLLVSCLFVNVFLTRSILLPLVYSRCGKSMQWQRNYCWNPTKQLMVRRFVLPYKLICFTHFKDCSRNLPFVLKLRMYYLFIHMSNGEPTILLLLIFSFFLTLKRIYVCLFDDDTKACRRVEWCWRRC